MQWRCCLVLVLSLLLAPLGPAEARSGAPVGEVMAAEFALQQGDLAVASRLYLQAAEAFPDPGLAERATRLALVGEQDALASRALSRWAELAPESLAMHAASVSLALRLGEHETAMEQARWLLAVPENGGYRTLLAVLSQSRGDERVIARSLMREVFAQRLLPGTLSDWLYWAALARRLDDPTLSDQVVSAGIVAFPEDPRVQVLEASRLRGQGKPAEARQLLQALGARPGVEPDVLRAAAAELAALDEPGAAARMLAKVPQDEVTLTQRAKWLASARDRDGLAALYLELQAGQTEPPPAIRLLLGHVAEALERWSAAEQWYSGIEVGQGHDLAALRRAVALEQLERRDEALALLRGFQGEESADGERVRDSYALEAELASRGPSPDDALAAFDRGLDVFEFDPVLLYGRAMLHLRRDQVDAALADLNQIIRDDPRATSALNAYAYTLAERRQAYAQALPFAERAFALNPSSAAILDTLGWIEYKLGRPERALSLLQKAWSLSKDAEIAAHLGEVLWVSGQEAQAREVWESGLALDPRSRALLAAMEQFKP
jgi:tetratricopeptide (TPR) repeat protein